MSCLGQPIYDNPNGIMGRGPIKFSNLFSFENFIFFNFGFPRKKPPCVIKKITSLYFWPFKNLSFVVKNLCHFCMCPPYFFFFFSHALPLKKISSVRYFHCGVHSHHFKPSKSNTSPNRTVLKYHPYHSNIHH